MLFLNQFMIWYADYLRIECAIYDIILAEHSCKLLAENWIYLLNQLSLSPMSIQRYKLYIFIFFAYTQNFVHACVCCTHTQLVTNILDNLWYNPLKFIECKNCQYPYAQEICGKGLF